MTPEALRARRIELSGAYARARRQHQGQARASERLREATTALLKAEVQRAKPRRGRPPSPRPINPDLFEESRP